MRFTLYQKILLAFLPTILIFFLIAGISFVRMQVMNSLVQENYYEGTVHVKLLGDAIASAHRVREHILLFNTVASNEEKDREQEIIDRFEMQTLELLEQYRNEGHDDEHDEGIDALLNEFDSAWANYIIAKQQIIQLSLSGQSESATQLFISGVAQELDLAVDLLLLVQDIEDNHAIELYDVGQSLYQNSILYIVGGTLLGTVLAVALAFYISRTIGHNVSSLSKAAKAVANGDLTQQVKVSGHDEVGVLADSFNQMVDRLNHNISTLERQRYDLEQRNEELDQFAYITSHDLKAPLRGIVNLSQWIVEDLEEVPAEVQEHITMLQKRVHRMEDLINAILDYSRANRQMEESKEVKVEELLHEIVETLEPPQTFTVSIGDNMPTLQTEVTKLHQVFSNLISNALKYHDRPDGNIAITVQSKGNFYEFSVKDDGPGIDPTFHKKIFDIFQTLQPRDKVESTGIGLAIVKKIVENQGGRISLESQEGAGATFRFTWQK